MSVVDLHDVRTAPKLAVLLLVTLAAAGGSGAVADPASSGPAMVTSLDSTISEMPRNATAWWFSESAAEARCAGC